MHCICINQLDINQQTLEQKGPLNQVISIEQWGWGWGCLTSFFLSSLTDNAKYLTVNVLQSTTHETKTKQNKKQFELCKSEPVNEENALTI